MSDQSTWLPSPELLAEYGFKGSDGYFHRLVRGGTEAVTWEAHAPEELGLFLWEHNNCRFNGWPQSEQEFHVILRQIRWI